MAGMNTVVSLASRFKLPLLVAAVALGGCADDDADVDDAATGFRSVSLALSSAVAGIDPSMQGNDDLSVDGTCAGGGSVTLEGAYVSTEEFELNVSFSGCSSQGVVIDGEMTYAGSVEVDASGESTSSRVEVSMTGNLEWSGEINGSCSIDMMMKIASMASQGMASAEVEASGSICGHSASAVVKAST